jgi:hypothetical protein
MMRRSITLTVATCAAVALVTLGSATAAHAANTQTNVRAVGDEAHFAGWITHIDDGDKFKVSDTYADGHGVRGSLLNSSGNTVKSVYNGNGAHGNYVEFGYDILPNVKYYIKVCLVDGASDTTPLKCASKVLYE